MLSPAKSQAAVGSEVEFTCNIRGNISWFHEGQPIVGDERLTKSDGNHKLIIKDVRTGDEGRYTCQGLNSEGIIVAQWGLLELYGKIICLSHALVENCLFN